MSNSQPWSAASYLKGLFSLRYVVAWKHVNIFENAVFTSIALIRSAKRVNISLLNKYDLATKNYHYVFKLLALNVLGETANKNFVDDILNNSDIANNNVFIYVYDIAFDKFIKDLESNYDANLSKAALNLFTELKSYSHIYCFEFLRHAKKQNIVDDLCEELYLLEEIELFKNRGFNNEDDASGTGLP